MERFFLVWFISKDKIILVGVENLRTSEYFSRSILLPTDHIRIDHFGTEGMKAIYLFLCVFVFLLHVCLHEQN